MSLESYRKALASQQERENQFRDDDSNTVSQNEMMAYVNNASPNNGLRKFAMYIFWIAFFLVAIISNPSPSEAKHEINSVILEKFNEHMRKEMRDEENDSWKQMGAGFAMLLAPALIDKLVQTEVSDCILFSTFNASVPHNNQSVTMVSGIIVFGKIIPLRYNSDLDFI